MEEKENFKNLRARFHVSQQDSEGSRGCKPPSPGGQSVFSAAMKQRHGFVANQLVKKDGSVSVLPTKPQVPKRMDLAHGPLSSPAPQARVQDHLNSKIQGEVAKCETRGSTSSSDTSPCSTLQKPGARKVFPDGRSKTGTFVSDVPQRSKAAEIQQSLMEKFAQSQGTTRAAATVPAKVPSLAVPQKSASESSLNIPKRKPLPSEKVLGPRPEKPRRPPSVNLDKFRKSPVAKTERSCANGNNSDRLKQKIPALSPLHSWAHLGPKPVFPPGLPQPANSSPSEAEEDYDDVATIEPYSKHTTPSRALKRSSPQQEYYVDVEMIPDDFPPPPVNLRELQPDWKSEKNVKKREKEENEFRKKFKFAGEIRVMTRMMVTPSAGIKRGGGKDLPFKKGELLDVIQLTNQEKIICRNAQGKYGFVPRRFLLQIEREIYDDVGLHEELYDDVESIVKEQPALPPKPRLSNEDKDSGLKVKNEKTLINKEKEEKNFRKKFKFEGDIKVVTRMMVTPSIGIKKGSGKDLPIHGGEILDVIQLTNKEKVLCRSIQGKYGYVRRTCLLQLELDIYDDVDN
ncbi:FYN-binding protein 1-like isoform X2 [Rhinatrema bivittatum]|uniref:FYN-binding protein 1-like isoform X2 n=1 Tax=Rhinatrema bivittatum TaxID=194408 RepID=UPI00112CA3C2|nr:FYN-binding protein 1-like isoform X2 [Rhinatrema bivittatum]